MGVWAYLACGGRYPSLVLYADLDLLITVEVGRYSASCATYLAWTICGNVSAIPSSLALSITEKSIHNTVILPAYTSRA